jgi:hypothetical protein
MQIMRTLSTSLHGEDEQLVLVQARYSPSNSAQAKREYYGNLIRVQLSVDGKAETLIPEIEKIPQANLIKWGEVW